MFLKDTNFALILIITAFASIGICRHEIHSKENENIKVISSAPIEVIGTPKKIGEMEFDVEVEERLPEKGDSAPEVVVFGENDNSLNLDQRSGKHEVDVLTGLPIDIIPITQRMGDIVFDIEVVDKSRIYGKTKVPEYLIFPDKTKSPEDSNEGVGRWRDLRQEGEAGNGSTISGTMTSINTTQTDSVGHNGSVGTPLPDEDIGEDITTLATTEQTGEDDENIPEENKPPGDVDGQTDQTSKASIWPIVFIILVFVLCAILGIIWAIIKWNSVKKTQKAEEEAQINAAKNGRPPPPAPQSAATPSASAPPPANTPRSPETTVSDGEPKTSPAVSPTNAKADAPPPTTPTNETGQTPSSPADATGAPTQPPTAEPNKTGGSNEVIKVKSNESATSRSSNTQ